jgi:hypothetical protein
LQFSCLMCNRVEPFHNSHIIPILVMFIGVA